MRACTEPGVRAFLLVWLIATGCAVRRPPVVVGGLPGDLDAFLASHPLGPGQALRADEVTRTATASYLVVQLRGAESPHRHRSHDLTVFLLRGEGVLTLDGAQTPLHAGDAAVISRDRVHWFARRGDETAVSFAVFTPPLDAPDSVPASVDPIPGRQ